MRILVVEDSPTVAYTLAAALVAGGYEVSKAADGVEALRFAAERQPNLILLDVILPKLNGYQVCRRLKAAPETAQIPVIMLTSKAKEGDRQWGIEQGADAYITKPFNALDLISAVERLGVANRPGGAS